MTIPNYTPLSLMPGENGSGINRSSPEYELQQQQLTIELQRILSPEGYALPKVDAETVFLLNTDKSIGSIIFNTTTGKAMVNESGTFKTITTS